ncbi:MAG: hypothetical protein JRF45_13990, partial [Deltaproteobacteria bacterium]|nr:hypothetical protein [Deltaproteobacteria bacterium]
MERVTLLAKFPIVVTNSVEEAEVGLTRSLTDASIMRVTDRNRFQLRMNAVNIGRTSMVFNRFGTDTKIKALDEDHIHFIIGSSIPSTINLYDGSAVASPQNAAM